MCTTTNFFSLEIRKCAIAVFHFDKDRERKLNAPMVEVQLEVVSFNPYTLRKLHGCLPVQSSVHLKSIIGNINFAEVI